MVSSVYTAPSLSDFTLVSAALVVHTGMTWEGFSNAHAWAPPIGSDEIGVSYSMVVRNFKSTSLTANPQPLPHPYSGGV